jgi:phosphoinositide-3-kinase regulatory subunit 4
MGQGYSLTTLSAGSAGIDAPELSDLAYEKALGDARFMKAIRARHRDGLVVAKVVMKPYSSLKFASYIESIIRERRILMSIPNALGYHRTFETSSNGYLVRQYVYSSIYDRLSTRPFLEDIEKKWLTFQLLCAVRDCHAKELYHGDIKTENVLVTSWSWLYLTDFSSSFKPTYLPEDNPADFSFFFDISGRRTCYLAPERFLAPGEQGSDQGVTWAMDIFSVGCVIAELFLETPIFSLSQLFKYRTKEYDPVQIHLNRIEDADIREMVTHMIKLEPESRYSADEYLNFWRQKAFPDYFYSFLHQYMHLITDPSSGLNPITSADANLGESDERIDRVYYDFDKISYLLGWQDQQDDTIARSPARAKGANQLFPLHLDLPDRPGAISYRKAPNSNDGALIFLTIVTSAFRSTARSTARVRACELLLAFSERITDEAKMDRVLPYLMSLLHDTSDICRVAALRSLTQLVRGPLSIYLLQ